MFVSLFPEVICSRHVLISFSPPQPIQYYLSCSLTALLSFIDSPYADQPTGKKVKG
jgi:hypothetical protein